ncbi:MAG: NADH-quinone oxidoreductase subunit J [Flavobacteriales bacterium]|nr:NADH-quinone oxidoreductase subunit J [Flavobacteriales bacterium]
MLSYLFYILGGLTIFTALRMILASNPVHSVLYLIATFFLISGQYLLMNAQFLFIVNLIVYAGAIMVLFLFVLMLLNLNKETEPQKSIKSKFTMVISAGILMITLLAAFIQNQHDPASLPLTDIGLVKNLGRVLFTNYVVPFEISSILFLAAMVGAVLVGKQKNEEMEEINE